MQEENIRWTDLLELAMRLFAEAEDWVTATYYSAGELVVHHWGSPAVYGYFVSKSGHTSGASTEPGVGASYADKWKFISGGGGVGPAGAAGATGSAGPAQVQQGRLTLSSGVPVPSADVTGAATLYFTPYKGHYIGLYYSGAWQTIEFSEESLALSGLAGHNNYDVFGYYDAVGEDLDIEMAIWKQVQASNSPTSGSNKTINLADTSGLAVDNTVTVRDGSHVEMAVITTVNTNTSIVVASLTYGYTTPYIGFPKTRATDLAWQDGVRVKSGDATRRYLGTIRTDASGTGEDSDANRLVFNQDNRVHRKLKKANDGTSHDYNSTTWRSWNNSDANRVSFVTGDDDCYAFMIHSCVVGEEAYFGIVGIGLDRVNNDSDFEVGNQARGPALSVWQDNVTAGYHFLQMMERCGTANTKNFYEGSNNNGGMSGYVMA